MRLTLRTLLAYRDQVLDPNDALELERRIRASSTAKTISERIDTVVTNPRIHPLPADARERGFDANHVASFLDGTMSMEGLPDMERKCLENNALLAEVASCHQILARAVAIPVSASPAFRERLLKLRGSALRTDTDPVGIGSQGGASEPIRSSLETRDELQSQTTSRPINVPLGGAGIELDDGLASDVPEYLRGTDRQGLYSGIKLVVLLVLLCVCAFMALGPSNPLAEKLRRTPTPASP